MSLDKCHKYKIDSWINKFSSRKVQSMQNGGLYKLNPIIYSLTIFVNNKTFYAFMPLLHDPQIGKKSTYARPT